MNLSDMYGDTLFPSLVGETITKIEGLEKGSEFVTLVTESGKKFQMFYEHDCCASCSIEDIIGDVSDLLNTPILQAEVSTNCEENPPGMPKPDYQDSFTWTFYKLATSKGYVTIRWYGESNGYYSESVTFKQVQQ